MPDPFLTVLGLDEDVARAVACAERFGATLSHEGPCVFVAFEGIKGRRLLARIDCEGYPQVPLDVVFLDPAVGHRADAPASRDPSQWPMGLSVLHRPNGWGICVAGTRAYQQTHGNPGFVMSLSRLVTTLVLYSRDQGALGRGTVRGG